MLSSGLWESRSVPVLSRLHPAALPAFRHLPSSVTSSLTFIHSALKQTTGRYLRSLSLASSPDPVLSEVFVEPSHRTQPPFSFLFLILNFSTYLHAAQAWNLGSSLASLLVPCTQASTKNYCFFLSKYFWHFSLSSDCLSSDLSVLPEFLWQDSNWPFFLWSFSIKCNP